jgi:hypothetical protein
MSENHLSETAESKAWPAWLVGGPKWVWDVLGLGLVLPACVWVMIGVSRNYSWDPSARPFSVLEMMSGRPSGMSLRDYRAHVTSLIVEFTVSVFVATIVLGLVYIGVRAVLSWHRNYISKVVQETLQAPDRQDSK